MIPTIARFALQLRSAKTHNYDVEKTSIPVQYMLF
jgi:hypothetical protein